jgi:pyruvate formate lyase activating enzyme
MKKADFFKKLENFKVQCLLCPHFCIIDNLKSGICKVRKNIDGDLFSINYGKIAAFNIDPIEKKPLYHFYPSKEVFSIGSFGCNLSCKFCQNYDISQNILELKECKKEKILDRFIDSNLDLIAYTYSEPIIWYEFVLDLAKEIKKIKKKNILITNGFINPDPFIKLLPYIDALNIDLKGASEEFYKNFTNSKLSNVIETIKIAHNNNKIVEITNLVITDENDQDEMIDKLIDIVANISIDIPLHFSRYFPNFKLNNPPTSIEKLLNIYKKAKKKLNHVYLGNMKTDIEANTYCPNCKKLLITRDYYNTKSFLKDNHCIYCNQKIYGEFN